MVIESPGVNFGCRFNWTDSVTIFTSLVEALHVAYRKLPWSMLGIKPQTTFIQGEAANTNCNII